MFKEIGRKVTSLLRALSFGFFGLCKARHFNEAMEMKICNGATWLDS